MPQSFRCDSCAAPLEFEGANSRFQRCSFCGNQVLIPAEVRQAFDSHFNFGGDLIGQAKKLKEIKNLALSGNTIQAIKLYRETFGCGLKEAKDAVDNIIAGKPIVFTDVQDGADDYNASVQIAGRPVYKLEGEAAKSVARSVKFLLIAIAVVIIISVIVPLVFAVIGVIGGLTGVMWSVTTPTQLQRPSRLEL